MEGAASSRRFTLSVFPLELPPLLINFFVFVLGIEVLNRLNIQLINLMLRLLMILFVPYLILNV